ncbi:MAG: tetratricopeptide repeat protein [Candidatus Omnitrophica bacterium]|nr:tetratricopeptide repeat protein [Candidatus Omnitrophota bacterium]
MNHLEPPDSHYLRAAIGWLELGNLWEANDELKKIAPRNRTHPDVLKVRLEVFTVEENWKACLDIAEAVIKAEPDKPFGWLRRSYSLRRVPNGGLQAAFDALLPAVGRFPRDSLIPFNLACYACQMGHLEDARQWLKRAMEVGGTDKIKRMALSDPDLSPLWEEIGNLGL